VWLLCLRAVHAILPSLYKGLSVGRSNQPDPSRYGKSEKEQEGFAFRLHRK
jgi:hypothetical protein